MGQKMHSNKRLNLVISRGKNRKPAQTFSLKKRYSTTTSSFMQIIITTTLYAKIGVQIPIIWNMDQNAPIAM